MARGEWPDDTRRPGDRLRKEMELGADEALVDDNDEGSDDNPELFGTGDYLIG